MFKCILCQRYFEEEGNAVDFEELESTFRGNVVFGIKQTGMVLLCEECFEQYQRLKNLNEEV